MIEKEGNNEFKFSLYQENVLLCEKYYNADLFDPFTRYFIDIRGVLPKKITKLQKVLSKGDYVVSDRYGDKKYNFLEYNNKMVNLYPNNIKSELRYTPRQVVQKIDDKTIRGVECKIKLTLNNNTIVERIFYVAGFNPVSRWSVDVVDTFVEICDSIVDYIKVIDIKNIWDNYELINQLGFNMTQIREMSTEERNRNLRKIGLN